MYNAEDEIRNGERHLNDVNDVNNEYSQFSNGILSNDEYEEDEYVDYISVPTSEHKRAKMSYVTYFVRDYSVPLKGTLVTRGTPRCIGPYILGPTAGYSPVKSIVQCIARKRTTNCYYTLKILTLPLAGKKETQDVRQGKMLLHNEYSLLTLLQDQQYVIHHHQFVTDLGFDEKINAEGFLAYTGHVRRRLCLVLDCLVSHEFDPKSVCYISLQQYVIREKKLKEREALTIFYNIVSVVNDLHKRNIVHRDLKLGNFILNLNTNKVTITNFCLGRQLSNENDLLTDQRGSPAYISPDVLCGKPYKGKPSDMWALGVVLYTMLFGQFPFYDPSPTHLFNKIKAVEYAIPNNSRISVHTTNLIRRLLILNPGERLNSSEVLNEMETIIAITKRVILIDPMQQIVPDTNEVENSNSRQKQERRNIVIEPCSLVTAAERNSESQRKVRTQNMRLSSQIPINRIGTDARELNCQELAQFQSILHERKHGPVPCTHRDMECIFQDHNSTNNSTNRNTSVNSEQDNYEVPNAWLW